MNSSKSIFKHLKLNAFISLFITVLFFSTSCQKKQTLTENGSTPETKVAKPDTTVIAPEVIDGLLHSIPSPLEISLLIKKTVVSFISDITNPYTNCDNYTTPFKQAVNLGVYSADIGYLGLYNKQTVSTLYVRCLRKLADELKVGQFFTSEKLQRARTYSTHPEQQDSLLTLITMSFEEMNEYLNEKNRRNVSVLIVTGAWIEALNLSLKVYEQNPSQALLERIGEQKITLDNIRLVLSVFKNFPEFAPLIEHLDELKKVYDRVVITYTYGEPEFSEEHGMLVVQDKSTSKVEITPDILNDIRALTIRIQKLVTAV